MFTLQRGVRHDQLVLVIWRSLRRGERPQKLWGLTGVGAGQNLLIFIDCLSPFLGELVGKHLYCNILMFRIYEGMKPARTFVTVQYNSTVQQYTAHAR